MSSNDAHQAPAIDSQELLREAMLAYAEAARAPSTRRAYRVQWSTFAAWCERCGRCPLPAEPGTLALFLASRARDGIKVASLGAALSAIRAAHLDASLSDPSAQPEFRAVWAGIRRTHGAPQRRVTPLTADLVRAAVGAIPSQSLHDLRGRALVLLGFTGAFRRSELVSLNVEDITPDPTRGLTVRLRRSKTDQAGAGADVQVPFGVAQDLCPVRAIEAWCAAAGVREGPLLRSVDRHGRVGGRLDGRDVARLLKLIAARAGVDPALVSGNSLRAGMATSAALSGRSDRAIMAQGRWASRMMVDRYVRPAGGWGDGAATGLLDEPRHSR